MEKMAGSFMEESNVGDVERVVSAALGAALIVKQFIHNDSSWFRKGAGILTGAYLIYRGITAFCPVRSLIEDRIESHN